MNLAPILDDCLQRLQAGETLAGCLARYPDHAADLAPMLAVAARVSALAGQAPSTEQRQRTLARLRQAGADQRARQRSRPAAGWHMPLFAARRLAVIAALALLLLTALSAGVIAASQPGQPAYELRVIVERVPAVAVLDPAARAAVELDTADRRLADLQGHLERTGQAQPAALRAMLAGDQAAARQAERAGNEARWQVAARLAQRAQRLTALAEAAPAAAQELALAANNTWRLAEQLQAGPPDQTPPQPPAAETAAPTSTPTASLTASAAPSDELWTATATPTASATSTPLRTTPDLPGTARPRPSHTPTSQAQTPPPHQTARPQLTETASAQPPPRQTSRPEQTAQAQTATAQAPTATPMPSATATAEAGDPEPTSTSMPEPTRPTPPRPGPGHTPPRP